MGVSENREPEYSTPKSGILVNKDPKIRYPGTPNFRKLPNGFYQGPTGFLVEEGFSVVRCFRAARLRGIFTAVDTGLVTFDKNCLPS